MFLTPFEVVPTLLYSCFSSLFFAERKAKTKPNVLKACTAKDSNSIRHGISRSFDYF